MLQCLACPLGVCVTIISWHPYQLVDAHIAGPHKGGILFHSLGNTAGEDCSLWPCNHGRQCTTLTTTRVFATAELVVKNQVMVKGTQPASSLMGASQVPAG
jgi:hypothetical protein